MLEDLLELYKHDDDDSRYYKWRCLISLAHVDGKLMREEQVFLRESIEKMAEPVIQTRLLEELTEDILNPKEADLFFDLIAHPIERILLLKLAYELLWSDGELDEAEEKMFIYIKNEIMKDDLTKEILEEELAVWDQNPNNPEGLKELLLQYMD